MDIFIIILLLLIAAEATYVVAVQPRKRFKPVAERPIFVDTSVLIDGRIIAVAQSGFISSTLMIPRSVIAELQFLADHGDTDKRARARHGLDVVQELQTISEVTVEIFQDGKAEDGVDNQLLKLAKQYKGAVCTIDYNLNKVAQVESLPVLNVNDLAMSLRMAYLPGEKILLELTQTGHDSHQAIGHLTDGTMVVVEQASQYVGKTVEVEFIRSLQTAAGKMMFARPVKNEQPQKKVPAEQAGRRTRSTTEKPQLRAAKLPPLERTERTAKPPRQQKSTSNRRSSRRPDHEASLIELVNNQDEH